ncbi:hypothetical protein LTR08_001227 [Meristemomyces frigidus]|nr:hypothetical protein LTR08_001227 [Meristemomyces frigidus]
MVSSMKSSHGFGAMVVITVCTALVTHLTRTMKFFTSLLGFGDTVRIIVATPKPYTPKPSFDKKLPAEIRVQIYGYVLQSANRLKRPGQTTPNARLVDTSILALNKLIRHEATPVFYENKTFLLELANIAACTNTSPHPLVNAQELDKPYRGIQIQCNAEGFMHGDDDLLPTLCPHYLTLCVLRTLEHLFKHADMNPKLQTILFRLGNNSIIPLTDALGNLGNVKLLCTAVGRYELTPRLPGMPKVTFEHTTVAALWEYYSVMSPNDPFLRPWSGGTIQFQRRL